MPRFAVVPEVRDEGRHVEHLGEGDRRRDLLVELGRVLEALQVERGHDRQLLHGQLLRGFLGGNAYTGVMMG